jgi:hypothetical protein
MHARTIGVALGACALLLSALLPAQGTQPAPSAQPGAEVVSVGSVQCTIRSRSQRLVLLLCPAGLDREALQLAGENACKPRVTCNAWIWDDAARMPAVAPATDAELPKHLTAQAVAVWAQDSKSLVIVRQVKN